MYSFMNDYSEGAHPRILELMVKSNLEQNVGYGEDTHTRRAKQQISRLLDRSDADIHFIPGGTQTNLLVISAFLRPHQAVISVQTGHINVHETGAIEATGHKVIAMPGVDGKLTPASIQAALDYHADEHMVQPKMVYISNSTELGTIYSKAELTAIQAICRAHGLLLFLDGARLGAALTCPKNDLTLADIAELVDVFYIGGTKNGALLGEALVICRKDLQQDFRYLIKQRGALMAKGFVTGMQFEALFDDDLFFQLGTHANRAAQQIAQAIREAGHSFYAPPCTNQLFPIVPNSLLPGLAEQFLFSVQQQVDEGRSVIRLVTSWATTEQGVAALCEWLRQH